MMDPEVLTRLIDRHAAALVLYARQWCAAAEDVVQEALIKLVAQRVWPRNVAAWLYRVVRNGAISAARAESRRRRHETQAAQLRCWFQVSDEAAADAEVVTRALRELLLEQREVIVAHLWGGLTFEQVGELAGCSSSTAHRRYLAGLAQLRERLGVVCPITNPVNSNTSKPL
jgi:RNA polymerase sigma-70 factor (ECF subfamily)